jgi:LysM repeat protein
MIFAGLTGCDYLERNARANEETEAHYIDGVTANKLHDFDKAISDFENAIKANPNSGAAHRELALLYDDKKNRHLRALYHYERFSELRTNEVTQVVRDRMFHCRVMVARENFETLERTQVRSQVEEMRRQLLDSQTQIEAFKRELAIARSMSNQVQVLQQQLQQSTSHVAQLETRLETQAQALAQAQAQAQLAQTQNTGPAQGVSSQPRSSTPSSTDRPTSQYPPSSRYPSGSRTPPSQTTPSSPGSSITSKPSPFTSVPSKRTHAVQSGETLSWVAKRYGVTLTALKAANPKVDPNRVRPGTVLNLP